jgi:hypothetical protein
MGFHDFGHDGEAQSGALARGDLAPPEPVENALALVDGDTGTAVGDSDSSLRVDLDHDLAARGRVRDRVLDQVADRLARARGDFP